MSSPPVTGRPYLDAVRSRPGTVLAFAHRGGAEHPGIRGLENTLTAFGHAVSLGYRWIETDVHLTADAVLVAFHDERLDRVTDGAGLIAELTLEQVRAARIGGVERVPTLVEVVEALPDCRFNIDLKSDAAVEPLARFLADHGLEERVLVGAFSRARLRRFRRLTGGRVATSAHPLEVALAMLVPAPAVLRALRRRGVDALQVPWRRRVGGRDVTVVTPGLVRRAHAAGCQVHVWTIDDPDEMAQLLDLGVDGLMTDRTDILRDVLRRRGQWWEEP